MLLDRRRINRWAKWMAIVLAIVFAISFVALGVGSGTGLNFGDVWRSLSGKNTASQAAPDTPEGKIKTLENTLASDPKNVNAMLGIATQYEELKQPLQAATFLEKAAAIQPDNADIYLRLGRDYITGQDYTSAVVALTKATELSPANANAFLQLGVAQRGAGNKSWPSLPGTSIWSFNPMVSKRPRSRPRSSC